ncbi:MAG: LysM peptidoglycan-binding domain-containing protein [Kofleriaceae bacterium]|nr:LysM peptidoglycan-binding domain-containing protein [Kofleriaceae bacterium]
MASKYLLISAAALTGLLTMSSGRFAAITKAQPAPASPATQRPAASATTDYVVVAGDSCLSIAKAQLGAGNRYQEIHQLNPSLGAEPHKLVPGSHLRLPLVTTQPDANLAQTRGNVQVRKPTTDAWAAALRGMDLFRTWRVGSLEKSSADVRFVDSTAMHMRENTVVIIYGPSVARTQTFAAVAELEKGSLETRLAQLGSKSVPQRVLTPSSVASLSPGEALIVVDDKGTSWVGNHAGGKIAVHAASKKKPRGNPVSVASGMGSKVDVGKLPGKPRPLPPSPTLSSGPSVFATGASVGKIAASWVSGGPTIGRYRAVLRDAQQQVLMTSDIAGSATTVEFADVPLGTYSIEVAAIDVEGFESIRSQTPALTLDQITFIPAGGATAEPLPAIMAVGSKIIAPSRVRCGFGDAALTETAVASALTPGLGPTEIHCESAISAQGPDVVTGEIVFRAAVEVVGLVVTTQTLPVLVRDEPTEISIAISSVGPIGDQPLTVQGAPGVRTRIVKLDDNIATVEVTITDEVLPGQTATTLALRLGDTELQPVELQIEVAAAPVELSWSSQRQHHRDLLELGGFVGGMIVSSASELGDAATNAGAVDSGATLGFRVAGILHPRWFAEGELALAPTGYIAQPGAATVISARAQLAGTALRDGRYQLRLLGGLGAAALLGALGTARDDTDIAVHGGAAFVVRASKAMWFRAQVIDQIFAAPSGGYAHIPEITLGLSTRVGW